MSYETALSRFIEALTNREIEYKKTHFKGNLEPATFEVHSGRVFDKVVRVDNGHSVYCFINKTTGGIVKAASWKAPEPKKRERGNIFNVNPLDGCDIYGVVYLR